jgi:hypothetical protein
MAADVSTGAPRAIRLRRAPERNRLPAGDACATRGAVRSKRAAA